MRNALPYYETSAHGNAPSTANTVLNGKIIRIAPKTCNNGNSVNDTRNAPLPPPQIYYIFTQKTSQSSDKKCKTRKLTKKNKFTRFLKNSWSRLFQLTFLSFSYLVSLLLFIHFWFNRPLRSWGSSSHSFDTIKGHFLSEKECTKFS